MDNDSEDAIAGNGEDEERCDTDTAGNNVNDGKGMDNDSEDAIAGNGEDEERSSRPPASQKPQVMLLLFFIKFREPVGELGT
jgi:hypothetical protein